MQQSKLTLSGISLFIIGVILIVIFVLSTYYPDSIPRTTLGMTSLGFGILFVLIGIGLLLFTAIKKLK